LVIAAAIAGAAAGVLQLACFIGASNSTSSNVMSRRCQLSLQTRERIGVQRLIDEPRAERLAPLRVVDGQRESTTHECAGTDTVPHAGDPELGAM